jgi:hypothetical protein
MAKTLKKTIKDMVNGVESVTRDPLGRFVTTAPTHRGVDVTYTTGASTGGAHMHVGDMSIPEWLNDRVKLLKEEEYKRGKKEALKKIWDLIPNVGDTTYLLNSGDSIITTRTAPMGTATVVSREVIVHKDFLFPENAGEEVPTIISEAIKELEVGWYQDDKADLYYYEGESHWKEVDLATNKQLTEDAILGKLEYIG